MRLVKNRKLYDKVIHSVNQKLKESSYNGDVISLLHGTDAIIFGGAVRDSIAELPVNDIDILSFGQSFQIISEKVRMNIAQNAEEYAHLRLPGSHYFTVYEDTTSVIQVITPSTYQILKNEINATNFIVNILSNVDISNSGVAIMPQKYPGYIIETVYEAIRDAENKEFRLTQGLMTTERLQGRINKLKNRGWKERFIPIGSFFIGNSSDTYLIDDISFDSLILEDKLNPLALYLTLGKGHNIFERKKEDA